MLPDLRVVIVAVISTFLLAVSVAFYTSARLGLEPRKSRPESLAAFDDSPVNRIALNWPEPVQPQPPPLDLDFAVSANSLRNPVREVTDDSDAPRAQASAPVPAKSASAAPAEHDPSTTGTIPSQAAESESAPETQPKPAAKVAIHTLDNPLEVAPAAESETKETPTKKRARTKKAKPAKAAKSEPAQTRTMRRTRPRATATGAANRSGFMFNFLGTGTQN